MLQQLALLAGFDLAAMGPRRRLRAHGRRVREARVRRPRGVVRRPRFADVPLERAAERARYADERRALVGERASDELRPGSPGGREPQLPPIARPRDGGGGCRRRRADARACAGDTCHLDVADRHGNLVSATPSGGWLQGSPDVPGLGLLPRHARRRCSGSRRGCRTRSSRGKRPRTTLSPSLVLRDGEPWMAFGTPGGDQQDQWQLRLLLATCDFGLNLQEAIDAPSFHSDHFPSSFYPRDAHLGGSRSRSARATDDRRAAAARSRVVVRPPGRWGA